MQIGSAIYYEKSTGNVILNTGDKQGDVVATTEDQDFAQYTALQPYQRSAVGVLQINFGDNVQNFEQYPYHVDVTQTPPVVVWDTTATDLVNAQKQKTTQLQTMLAQTLNGGFTSKTNGHSYVTTTNGQANMEGDLKRFELDSTLTSLQFYTINAGWTAHSHQDLINAFLDGGKWKDAQYTQLNTLIGQVDSATTVNEVNAIQWTPSTY